MQWKLWKSTRRIVRRSLSESTLSKFMPIRLLTSGEMQLVQTVETNTATNASRLQPYVDSAGILARAYSSSDLRAVCNRARHLHTTCGDVASGLWDETGRELLLVILTAGKSKRFCSMSEIILDCALLRTVHEGMTCYAKMCGCSGGIE